MTPAQQVVGELSVKLRQKHDAWWKALLAGEWVWAAYYANDIEVIARQLTNATHTIVEEKHADPKSALVGNRSPYLPSKKGDRG